MLTRSERKIQKHIDWRRNEGYGFQYQELPAFRCDGVLNVFCPDCLTWHVHGGGKGPGDCDGHRAAHCMFETAFKNPGYVLREVGQVDEQFLNTYEKQWRSSVKREQDLRKRQREERESQENQSETHEVAEVAEVAV